MSDPSRLRTLVKKALTDLSGESSPAVAPLARWIDTVARWNERIDLTAARSDEELVDLLVADAAILATLVDERRAVVDVGTGAGAPGLPLALLRPDLRVTLVEPLAKRVALLRTVVGAERLTSVTVVRGKGEDLATRFDLAMSRATLPPPAWAALGAKLADETAIFLAQGEPPEGEWRVDRRYAWPLTGALRRLVLGRARVAS